MKNQLSTCESQERVIDKRFKTLLNTIRVNRYVRGSVRAGEIGIEICDIPVLVLRSVVIVEDFVLDEREKHLSEARCV